MRFYEIIREDAHGDEFDRLSAPGAQDYLDTLIDALRKGRKVSHGPTLLDFIARSGGLSDDGGELSAMDAEKWHRLKAFRRKLVTPRGLDLEGMSQRAWEAGYFPDDMEAPEPWEFLEAIRRELAGKPIYSHQRDSSDDFVDAMQSLDDYLSREGVDIDDESEVRAALRAYNSEPSTEEIPF